MNCIYMEYNKRYNYRELIEITNLSGNIKKIDQLIKALSQLELIHVMCVYLIDSVSPFHTHTCANIHLCYQRHTSKI